MPTLMVNDNCCDGVIGVGVPTAWSLAKFAIIFKAVAPEMNITAQRARQSRLAHRQAVNPYKNALM